MSAGDDRIDAILGHMKSMYVMVAVLASGFITTFLAALVRWTTLVLVLAVLQAILIIGVFAAALANLKDLRNLAPPLAPPVPKKPRKASVTSEEDLDG